MSIFIAEEEKLRRLIEAIKIVNDESIINVTATEFNVRAVDATHNFTALVRLNPSWFRFYPARALPCKDTVNIQSLDAALGSVFKHACFYTIDARNLPAPSELYPLIVSLGMNPCETRFVGYRRKDPVRDVPWPEDRAIHDHKFSLEMKPQDWEVYLKFAIGYNVGTVSVHMTDWKVSLIGGGIEVPFQVYETVSQGVSCRIKYDPTRGARGSAQLPNTYLPPGGLDHTIQLHPSTHMPLLKAVEYAESVFLHFTYNDDDMTVYVPPAFQCLLNGEGPAATFYFILPPAV